MRRITKAVLIFAALGLGIAACTAATTTPDTGTSLDSSQNQFTASAEPAAKKAPKPGIGQGTWEVGTDIKAGKYKSKGGDLCYWERQRNADNKLNSIIDNSASPGPQVVTIKRSDYAFKTEGCGRWVRQ